MPSLIQSGFPGQTFPHLDTPRPPNQGESSLSFQRCSEHRGDAHTFPTQRSIAAAWASGWGRGGKGRGKERKQAGLAPRLLRPPQHPSGFTLHQPCPGFLSLPPCPSIWCRLWVKRDGAHCGVMAACQEQAELKPHLTLHPCLIPPGYLPLRSPLNSAGWQPPQRILAGQKKTLMESKKESYGAWMQYKFLPSPWTPERKNHSLILT